MMFLAESLQDFVIALSFIPLIFYMDIQSMKVPIVFGLIDGILEFFYAFSFHVGEKSNIDDITFGMYKASWIVFNFLTAPVMIQYKFYSLSFYFITYAIIETVLLFGYFTTGLYFKITS